MLTLSFLIESSSKLLITRTGIIARFRAGSDYSGVNWPRMTKSLHFRTCIMFRSRLDQNSGVHGNRKPPLTYNGENGVATFFSVPFEPILFILAGNKVMHKITDEFEFRPDRTTDYGVSCP